MSEKKNNMATASEAVQLDDVLLDVRNLKEYFPVKTNMFGKVLQSLKAVDGVSFTVRKGETLGIVGESGCGKTTMGRTLLRLYPVTGGEVYFKGQEVTKLSNREFDKLRPQMQMMFQDPFASLSPRLTVGEIIGEAALEHGLVDKAHYREYVLDVMKKCGLQPHYYERYPHEFSGGQRQRICIARALALKPDLVVCDEPVSALDVSIQAQVINMLIRLQKEMGLTYLFVAHDLSMVKHISDRVAVMYLGQIVEITRSEELYSHPLHPYTQALLSAIPIPDPVIEAERESKRIHLQGEVTSPINPAPGCRFASRCPYATARCKQENPTLKDVGNGHQVACFMVTGE